MRPRAPVMVLIFRDIGQMRKIGKGANNLNRLLGGQIVKKRLQLTSRGAVGIAVEADRGLADLLDKVEDCAAFLFADRVAEKSPEEANIGTQRLVLVGLVRYSRLYRGRSWWKLVHRRVVFALPFLPVGEPTLRSQGKNRAD